MGDLKRKSDFLFTSSRFNVFGKNFLLMKIPRINKISSNAPDFVTKSEVVVVILPIIIKNININFFDYLTLNLPLV